MTRTVLGHDRGVRSVSGPATGRPAPLKWDAAREAAYRSVTPLFTREVLLASAGGGVLARPLHALVALPVADRAAMDGYAVSGPGPWTVVAATRAGDGMPEPLGSGTACEIATGAPVPASTLAVLPYEHSKVSGTQVVGTTEPGKHVRRMGEQCIAGELVLADGTVLGPAALGLAASLGYDTVPVRTAPRVCALVTGDELLTHGVPTAARVRDAIGPMLPGLTEWAGGRFEGATAVTDSHTLLVDALGHADAEVVLVSGSSSRGPADHLRSVLVDLDCRLVVDGVRCRPGHPQALAQLPDGRLVIGLPGNPLAAYVAFLTLALPAITGLRGLPLRELPSGPGLAGRRSGLGDATRLLPVRVQGDVITEVPHSGSAMLRGVASADALAVLTPNGAVRLHPLP